MLHCGCQWFYVRDIMSVDGTTLLFEGFLQKRKDTMKLRWVTYWFRLQNTSLFFYTQKNGSASHLRGHYYIYTVQSVREVQRVDSKRFMFEIIMTNGKRKLLAAETAALRKEWVGCLWQAMNLSTSGVSDSSSTHLEVREQRERLSSSSPASSLSVMESLPARPLSAPSYRIRSVASICLPEMPSRDTLPDCSYPHHTGDGVDCVSNAEGIQEGDYDILPLRKKVCEIKVSTEVDEGVYDFPVSYRRAAEHPDPTESIYDVPSTLLRSMPDHTLEEQPEDGAYWKI